MATDTLIQIFTRAPVPGAVKTRLIEAIGAEGAADLHAQLADRLIRECEKLDSDVEIWCAADPDHPFFSDYNSPCLVQSGRDLGQRMRRALKDGLMRYNRVVLVGTDLPEIDGKYIENAFLSLKNRQVVLAPALDGGFGLIGVQSDLPDVFSGISWGRPNVLESACRKLNAQRLHYALLPCVWDVDNPEDLSRYETWRNSHEKG